MKILSVAIPCYHSQAYMAHAIESVLSAAEFRDRLEILIIDDGSRDDTGKIADQYEQQYPGVIRAIHQDNGGHGGAVMTGLRHVVGKYFKVLDSDDWLDEAELPGVIRTLEQVDADLFICNYVYEKAGKKHKHVMRCRHAFPVNTVFRWPDTRPFPVGQYLLMHSMIYRTRLLLNCGLELPRHTFYVDELYAYVPLKMVQTMYYMDVSLYHYFI